MAEKIVVNLACSVFIGVDIQPTFMFGHKYGGKEIPAGGLPVSGGDEIISVIKNKIFSVFPRKQRIFTRDHHPFGHVSFASSYVGKVPYTKLTYDEVKHWNESTPEKYLAPHAQFTMRELKIYMRIVQTQMLWPDHGVQDTDEAKIHPAFSPEDYLSVILKGTDGARDSYSAHYENDGTPTGLTTRIRRMNITDEYVGGNAGDVCGAWTAIDGCRDGFNVYFIADACGYIDIPGVDGHLGSKTDAFSRMEDAGVKIITADQLVAA